MASTAQRAALSRALGMLSAKERNCLTMHGRFGINAVADFLRTDTAAAESELARIKAKLEPIVARELRKPPELPTSSSLRPPERITMGHDRPLLRSRGEIKASTPAKRKVGNYKPKPCKDCGKEFKPQAPRQVKCDDCRGVAPVSVRTDPSVVRAPVSPPPNETLGEAILDAAGVEEMPAAPPAAPAPPPAPSRTPAKRRRPGSTEGLPPQYVSLRDELTTIQARLHSFAGRLDRLMENVQIPEQRSDEK